jgi:hypothetical protein
VCGSLGGSADFRCILGWQGQTGTVGTLLGRCFIGQRAGGSISAYVTFIGLGCSSKYHFRNSGNDRHSSTWISHVAVSWR